MAKLIGINTPEPFEFVLTDAETTIGRTRANKCELKDEAASSRHAIIVKQNGDWLIVDKGSRNGTFVNDTSVSSCVLANGDSIQIGHTQLRFEDTGRGVLYEEDAAQRTSNDVLISLDLGSVASGRVQAGAELSEPERKLRLIGLVSEKLVRIPDDQKLSQEILKIVIEQLGADRGFVCLFDENSEPKPLAVFGLEAGEQPRISRTVLTRLLQEKTGVVFKPCQTESIRSLVQSGVSSTLYAPLWTGDSIVGFMSLDSTRPGKSFSESDLDLVLTIAHQTAVGLERSRLTEAAEKEKQLRASLSKYLDEKIARSLMSSAQEGVDPLAPQEREVTVLFSDIVSFTKMSEGLPPAKLAEFIRQYLTAMTDIIFRHEGTTDKYIGDAIMALWGAPLDNPKAAECAIRAALEMRDCAKSIAPPKEGMPPLRVRFGINTGMLTVGNLGSERRKEYTAIGDTVNVASRLETFARPDEIVISEVTYSKVAKDSFAVQEIGTIDVKNRAQPLQVYKVLGDIASRPAD